VYCFVFKGSVVRVSSRRLAIMTEIFQCSSSFASKKDEVGQQFIIIYKEEFYDLYRSHIVVRIMNYRIL